MGSGCDGDKLEGNEFERVSNTNRIYVPKLDGVSKILQRPLVQKIVTHLPFSQAKSDWIKLFDSSMHGSSLAILSDKVFNRGPTLFIMKIQGDQTGHVFGFFASNSWKFERNFYGTPDSFLFCVNSKKERIRVFRSSGINNNFQYASKVHGICMGGKVDYFTFQIEKDIIHVKGREKTATFPSSPDLCDPHSSNSIPKEEKKERDIVKELDHRNKIEILEVYGFPLNEKDKLDLKYQNKLKSGRENKNLLDKDNNPDMFILKSSGVLAEHRHVHEKQKN